MEHEVKQKSGDGYGDVYLECSCGWRSRNVNLLGDNFAMRTLSRLKNEHLRAGTAYPTGGPLRPVSNLTDALLIADQVKKVL